MLNTDVNTYAFKTRPWAHQMVALNHVCAHPAAALFMEMGSGKSKVVVDFVSNQPLGFRAVILCPKSVRTVWERQFAAHASSDVECHVLSPATLRAIERGKLGRPNQRTVLVTNYDAAWRGWTGKSKGAVSGTAAELLSFEPHLVVCDESHRIKAHDSKQSKFAWALGGVAQRRIVLTGTPQPNNQLDYFGQFRFLDQRILGTSWTAFRSEYARLGGPALDWYVCDRNTDKLVPLVAPYIYSVKAADVLDLPTEQDIVLTGAFAPQIDAKYRAFERDALVVMEQAMTASGDLAVFEAKNALAQVLRLQQFTAGAVKDVTGDVQTFETPKRALLCDLMEDLPPTEPVVVFCRFRSDLDLVRAAAAASGREYLEQSGTSADWATFQDGKGGSVLGCIIQAGGVGIDLTRARYAVYLSTGHSAGDYQQSRARILRPGQTRHCTYYHLHVENTVDGAIHQALGEKIQNAAGFLRRIVEARKGR